MLLEALDNCSLWETEWKYFWSYEIICHTTRRIGSWAPGSMTRYNTISCLLLYPEPQDGVYFPLHSCLKMICKTVWRGSLVITARQASIHGWAGICSQIKEIIYMWTREDRSKIRKKTWSSHVILLSLNVLIWKMGIRTYIFVVQSYFRAQTRWVSWLGKLWVTYLRTLVLSSFPRSRLILFSSCVRRGNQHLGKFIKLPALGLWQVEKP